MARRKSVRIIFGSRGRLTYTGYTGLWHTLAKIWLRREREANRDYLTTLKAEKIKVDTAVSDMRSEKLAKENYILELKIKEMENRLRLLGITQQDFTPLDPKPRQS